VHASENFVYPLLTRGRIYMIYKGYICINPICMCVPLFGLLLVTTTKLIPPPRTLLQAEFGDALTIELEEDPGVTGNFEVTLNGKDLIHSKKTMGTYMILDSYISIA